MKKDKHDTSLQLEEQSDARHTISGKIRKARRPNRWWEIYSWFTAIPWDRRSSIVFNKWGS